MTKQPLTLIGDRTTLCQKHGHIFAQLIKSPEEGDALLRQRQELGAITLVDGEGTFLTEGYIHSAAMPDEREDGNFMILIEGESKVVPPEKVEPQHPCGIPDITEAHRVLERRDDRESLHNREFLISLAALKEMITDNHDLYRSDQDFTITLRPAEGVVIKFGADSQITIKQAEILRIGVLAALELIDEGDNRRRDMQVAKNILSHGIDAADAEKADSFAVSSFNMPKLMDGADYALSLLKRENLTEAAENIEQMLIQVYKAN